MMGAEKLRVLRTHPGGAGKLIGWLVFCLWLQLSTAPGVAAGPAKQSADLNVVYLWVDTLRADHLGCYGYGRETSPNLDRLAGESVVFENAYTPHTVTLTSFMSITTSLYPFSHGVLYVAKDRLAPKIRTLPEILQLYGYRTVWFGPAKDPHLSPEVGFGRGFDELHDFDKDLAVTRGRILKTLESVKDRKFFLNVHTYHVHSPYTPGEAARSRFTVRKALGLPETEDDIKRAAVAMMKMAVVENRGPGVEVLGEKAIGELAAGDIFGGGEGVDVPADRVRDFLDAKGMIYKYDDILNYAYDSKLKPDDPEVMDYAKALYDAEIYEYDTEILGPLLEKLKELGLYEKTMVVLIADHGEEFGEHGGVTHGKTLYEEVVHIPWIMRIPGQPGKRIAALVQTVDIMPTILGELGIPLPHQAQGLDFSPTIRGLAQEKSRAFVYGQMPWQISIRSGRWKIQFFKGTDTQDGVGDYLKRIFFSRKELFDLATDPHERHNLHPAQNDRFDALFHSYQVWESSLPNYRDADYDFHPSLDAKTIEKIKKTGYW